MMKIHLENCSLKIKNDLLLQNINFELEEGVFYHLFGENGSGKSLFLQSILGLTSFFEGKKTIEYEKSALCYVTSIPFYFDNETVNDVIKVLSKLYRRTREEAVSILELLNLDYDDIASKRITELSQGMRQKLVVLPLFFDNLDFFVLDEIFVAFDSKTQGKLIKRLITLFEQRKTVILVEHNEKIIESLAETIGMRKLKCQNKQISVG